MNAADQYIGIPWADDGYGDDRLALWCWGLVRLYYREQRGIELARFDHVRSDDPEQIAGELQGLVDRGEWQPVTTPADGDLVLMSHRLTPHHVGLWAADRVVHITRFMPVGVEAQTLQALTRSRFGNLRFLRQNGDTSWAA